MVEALIETVDDVDLSARIARVAGANRNLEGVGVRNLERAAAMSLTGRGGAIVEHGIAPGWRGGAQAASYCTSPSSGFSVSAGQRNPLTVLGVKGSQVQILSSRRHGRGPVSWC